MPQSTGWLSVTSSSICFLRVRTRGESVSTRMPLATGMLQAMSSQPWAVPSPSTSTMQIRQLPGTDRAGCQQKNGMTWPLARAACITVWPSSASTRSPSMKISTIEGHLGNSPFGADRLEPAVVLRAAVHDPVLELVAVLGEDADRRVAGGVAHAADRRAVVGLGDRDQALDVVELALAGDDAVDDLVQPAHAFAARRALAARLVVIEANEHLQQADHARAFGDDDHAARAETRACRDQAGVIEREQLDLGGGEHLGRDAAGDDALELLAAEHAAAVLVDELRERVAVFDFVHAGPRHVSRDRDQLRARALRGADLAERLGAVAHDARDVGERLDVVDDGRPLVEAAHGEARRPVARVALPAFERGQQARRLAADVRAGAPVDDDVARERAVGDAGAEQAGRIRLLDRAGEASIGQVELAADVDEGMAHLQREGGDQHRLDQQVRRVLEDPAVLEGAGLALVGIGAEIVRLLVVELDHAPLAPGREGRAAVAEDSRRGDFLGDLLRAHLAHDLLERGVAAARAVFLERVRQGRDREGHQELAAGGDAAHRSSLSISASSRSGVMFSWYVSLTITTGAVPHEPRHSTVENVKRRSGVVSPGAMPSRAPICSITPSAPRIEHATLPHACRCQRPTGWRRNCV